MVRRLETLADVRYNFFNWLGIYSCSMGVYSQETLQYIITEEIEASKMFLIYQKHLGFPNMEYCIKSLVLHFIRFSVHI